MAHKSFPVRFFLTSFSTSLITLLLVLSGGYRALTYMIPAMAVSTLPSSPAEAKGTESLLTKVIAAHGGKSRLQSLNSVTLAGEVQVLDRYPGKFEMLSQGPNRFRMEWDIGNAKEVLSIDHDQVWQQGESVRELSGDEKKRLKRVPLILNLSGLMNLELLGNDNALERDENENLVIRLRDFSNRKLVIYIDSKTYLIVGESRIEPYEEGSTPVSISYSDYREVNGIMLPFQWQWSRSDVPLRVFVEKYNVGSHLDDDHFVYPHANEMKDMPYNLSVTILPKNIYKKDDGQIFIGNWYRYLGMPYAPTESWVFHAVVNERFGRYLEPEKVVISLYRGDDLIRDVQIGSDALNGLRSYPVARFNSIPEIYNFRHAMHEVKSVEVDRVVYTYKARIVTGESVSVEKEFALQRYQLKNNYIFPLKGKFSIPNAFDHDMRIHNSRSMHFSYDIMALGPSFEMAKNNGAKSSDFYAFRKTEIIAPAAGTVVYARNDVPDTTMSVEYLRDIRDPHEALAGNVVVIDHSKGEDSLLAHMAKGTVRVKTGDKVEQGDVLGMFGSSGPGDGLPHLHYQLQSGPGIFEDDPLPVVFDNVSQTGLLEIGGAKLLSPGLYYEAK